MIKTQTFELKINCDCLPLNARNVIKQTKFLFLSEKIVTHSPWRLNQINSQVFCLVNCKFSRLQIATWSGRCKCDSHICVTMSCIVRLKCINFISYPFLCFNKAFWWQVRKLWNKKWFHKFKKKVLWRNWHLPFINFQSRTICLSCWKHLACNRR